MTPPQPRPTLTETAAVLAAVRAYLEARGLADASAPELPVYLAELKESIEKVESLPPEGDA